MEAVATDGRKPTASVADELFREPQRFEFLQAIRLLEQIYAERTPPGESLDPGDEIVRFRATNDLGFAAGEITGLEPGANESPARMTVSFMGLGGALGPLPHWVSELISSRAARRDYGLRDFLDLFLHRLVSLFTRARKRARPTADLAPPSHGRFGRVALALAGLGTPALRDRSSVPDQSLLMYTGMLTGIARTQAGLERILSDYFHVPVQVRSFRGAWLQLQGEDRTLLGAAQGCNHRLGDSAVIGKRVWDQGAGFEVAVGPLPFHRYLDFLPGGASYDQLGDWLRLFAGSGDEASIRLHVDPAETPVARLGAGGSNELGWSARLPRTQGPSTVRLGRSGAGRLGWTSWLQASAASQKESQIVLRRRG